MQASKVGSLVATLLIGALVAAVSPQDTIAKQKLDGQANFDCSCTKGNGNCTFTSTPNSFACYRGTGDTCNGSCTLTTTTGAAASATKGATGAKSGVVKGEVAVPQ
jgi:hypothetical protein